ncbi:MAG: HD domain-containing protein [Victivallaceae bacterium]|nr:HD domain-containing protein [Victivallaceae bacterium]
MEKAIGGTMNEEKLLADMQEAVRTRLSGACGCHDFDHTMRVVVNAETLLESHPGADPFLVRLGALLHDCCRPEEDASDGRIDHAELGGVRSREMLSDAGCGPDVVEAVGRIVERHRFRGRGAKPQTIEEKIVHDADKLDSLGAVGVGRAFLFAGRIGARLHNSDSEALESAPYTREDTAYREYLVKLRSLPECMLTLRGRELAAERLDFMKEFFRRLNLETATEPPSPLDR